MRGGVEGCIGVDGRSTRGVRGRLDRVIVFIKSKTGVGGGGRGCMRGGVAGCIVVGGRSTRGVCGRLGRVIVSTSSK